MISVGGPVVTSILKCKVVWLDFPSDDVFVVKINFNPCLCYLNIIFYFEFCAAHLILICKLPKQKELLLFLT